jgi:hypothetical protein
MASDSGILRGMADQRQAGNELLATGNTSDVWLTSPSTVLKLLRLGVPQHWASIEADITDAVHAAGPPVPAVEDTVIVDGRPSIVFERIHGTSLWECMQASPSNLPQLVASFVGLQSELHDTGPIPGVPDLVGRLSPKIGQAQESTHREHSTALGLLATLPPETRFAMATCTPATFCSPTGAWSSSTGSMLPSTTGLRTS